MNPDKTTSTRLITSINHDKNHFKPFNYVNDDKTTSNRLITLMLMNHD